MHALRTGLNDWLTAVNAVIWHDSVLYIVLAVGLLFTIWSGFCQYHALTHGVRVITGRYDDNRDPGAITAARANATRGGVLDHLSLAVRPLSACEPPSHTPQNPGLVVCNPPYGVRVGKRGPLRDLHAQLGHVLRDRWPGAHVALLCGDELWRHCGLPLQVARSLQNGGLPVQLVLGRVPG